MAVLGVLTAAEYHSPHDIAAAPDGARLVISDHTGGQAIIAGADGALARRVDLRGRPGHAAWAPGGDALYVAEYGAWSVAEIDPASGEVRRRITVGRYPRGLAASDRHLVVANSGVHTASIIDRSTGTEVTRVPCLNTPWGVAMSRDGALAVVGNALPRGDARSNAQAAALTVIDVVAGSKLADVRLPTGSINLHGVAISPDGRWAYVVHSLGRYTLPTTQLERGWVMTHGMSVIDLQARQHYATVLFDTMTEGAADPWQIALSDDGATAWVSLAGVHQVARLDLARFHDLLAGTADADALAGIPDSAPWYRIKEEGAARAELVNDLSAMHQGGVLQRFSIPARGPRGLARLRDDALAVASYFSGEVLILDGDSLEVAHTVALGTQPAETDERAGERLFYDAEQCMQHWLSCASCHPNTRADGLNWDLLNDGIGNPKNTKSLVYSHRTPPVMWTGVRKDMSQATQKGFMFIQFRVMAEQELEQVRSYLRSVPLAGSPYLVPAEGAKLSCSVCHHQGVKRDLPAKHMAIDGQLSAAAQRGLKLYRSDETDCMRCHPGPRFTDLKSYDVGTRHQVDRRDTWDTPSCYELWATAPYLHDGSAATLEDMLGSLNREDKHGKTSHLSEQQLADLAAYLRSL